MLHVKEDMFFFFYFTKYKKQVKNFRIQMSLLGSILFIGSTKSTNVGEMVQKAITKESVSIHNTTTGNASGSNTIGCYGDCRGAIFNGDKQTTDVTIDLKSTFKEMMKQQSQQDLAQNLDQQAKGMMNAFVGIGSSEASNYLSQTMHATIDLTNSTVNTCAATVSASNSLVCNGDCRGVKYSGLVQTATAGAVTKCVADISIDQGASITMSQKASQTATNANKFNWWILVVVGVILFIAVAIGCFKKIKVKVGIILALLTLVTWVALYNQWGQVTLGYIMIRYAYSPLLKTVCPQLRGERGLGMSSVDAAAEDCKRGPRYRAVDYECFRDGKKITPVITLYTTWVDPKCVDALAGRQGGPPSYSVDNGKVKAKTPNELDEETNYTLIKRFNGWYHVAGAVLLLVALALVLSGSFSK